MKHVDIVASTKKFAKAAAGIERAYALDVKAVLKQDDVEDQRDALIEYRKTLDNDSHEYNVVGHVVYLLGVAAEGEECILKGWSLRGWVRETKAALGQESNNAGKKKAAKNPLKGFEGTDRELVAHVLAYYENNEKGLAAFIKLINKAK